MPSVTIGIILLSPDHRKQVLMWPLRAASEYGIDLVQSSRSVDTRLGLGRHESSWRLTLHR